MKNKILLILILFASSIGFSQEDTKSFSLDEAIKYALEHNRTIKNANLSIQAAEQQKWETTATGLPQINGTIQYLNNIKTPFPPSNNPNDPFNFFFPKHSIKPDVTLTQLLFDGTYIVALQASKVFLDISKNAKEKTDAEIKKAAIAAYSNAILTKESIIILKKNINSLQENLNEMTVIFENGLTEEENVEQLQLTLSQLQNNLKSLNNLEEISKGYLKLLLGIEANVKITLTDSIDQLVTENISLELISSSFSVNNNIDYRIAENDAKSKKLLYKLERYRQLPSIGAFLSTNYQNFTNDSFGSLFNSEDKWLSTTTAGVNISFPIFTSFQGRARQKKAKFEWEISLNQLEEMEEKLQLDISKAKDAYTLSIDTYGNKEKNLALAERIEVKNTTKYKEGLASSFELRQAQMQLYNSQQEYLQSMIDVINKKAELENILNIK